MKIVISFFVLILIGFTNIVDAKNVSNSDSKISGTVCEKVKGEEKPVPFANILCKGTTVGTFAGVEGNFTLDVEEGKHTIVISCVGYEPITKTIKVKKNKPVELSNIELKPAQNSTAYKE